MRLNNKGHSTLFEIAAITNQLQRSLNYGEHDVKIINIHPLCLILHVGSRSLCRREKKWAF